MTLTPCTTFTRRTLAVSATALLAATSAQAQEAFTYVTNWYAQAEHGGYYQAVATGIYKRLGLDVTIRMGGPQVNIYQIMAAGQADCVMGSSDLQAIQVREGGLPVTTVAALFQKDPQVLIAHEGVKGFEDMKDKTILISALAHRGFWPWLKAKYGLTDAQVRPYTFNIQPFMADKNIVQQGYLTSEPFAIQRAGAKATAFMFSDFGFPAYANTVACLDKTIKDRNKALAAFVRGSAEGWKSYFENPAPANAMIKKDNPSMTDEQLAYSVAKLKEMGIVTGGGASKNGIGSMDIDRVRKNHAFLLENKLVDAGKLGPTTAYNFDYIKDLKVMP